tara:strand:+ start:213 stop:425 length:213 start_codon:yes stop_codon:yes gene_type:complete
LEEVVLAYQFLVLLEVRMELILRVYLLLPLEVEVEVVATEVLHTIQVIRVGLAVAVLLMEVLEEVEILLL